MLVDDGVPPAVMVLLAPGGVPPVPDGDVLPVPPGAGAGVGGDPPGGGADGGAAGGAPPGAGDGAKNVGDGPDPETCVLVLHLFLLPSLLLGMRRMVSAMPRGPVQVAKIRMLMLQLKGKFEEVK